MHLDADLRAEALAAERYAGSVRAACAYLALAFGVTGSLAILPSMIAMLAARGLQ